MFRLIPNPNESHEPSTSTKKKKKRRQSIKLQSPEIGDMKRNLRKVPLDFYAT